MPETTSNEIRFGRVVGYHSVNAAAVYGFKGSPEDGLYLGVELETEVVGDRNATAAEVERLLPEFVVPMHDGSLRNGVEIVSAPASYEEHAAMWRRLFEHIPQGMTSWDNGRCGLHVHVSREPLGQETILRVVQFVNNPDNRQFIQRIAGRAPNSYWALRPEYFHRPALALASYSRYEAVNLQNSKTIEFRMFRGTLRATRFFAALEFTLAICRYCRQTITDWSADAFAAWVAGQGGRYANLLQIIRETRAACLPVTATATVSGIPVTSRPTGNGTYWSIFGHNVHAIIRALIHAGLTGIEAYRICQRLIPELRNRRTLWLRWESDIRSGAPVTIAALTAEQLQALLNLR